MIKYLIQLTLIVAAEGTSRYQRRMWNPDQHLRWTFFYENGKRLLTVNFFGKNGPWEMFDWVLNTPPRYYPPGHMTEIERVYDV